MKNKILFNLCLFFGLMFINEGLSKFFNHISVREEMALSENGKELHEWMFPIKKFQRMLGKEGDTEGINDDLV